MPERTLQRRFVAEVGVGPKAYQRVARSRRAFALVSAAPERGLAAADIGQGPTTRPISTVTSGASRERRRARSSPALAKAFASGEDR